MHNFFDGTFATPAQTGRGFGRTAHLHKKAGFLRAGEAGEQARAERWDGIAYPDYSPACCDAFYR